MVDTRENYGGPKYVLKTTWEAKLHANLREERLLEYLYFVCHNLRKFYVCAIAENLLPVGLETSGQRVNR